ncbi:very-long-chain 3-oxoacyl-coa reductase 1 [Phtheirospermum japonicum]|uniref:Very-long-chain 3-oxoacyl-coa reductase 1 n=1 Tax=Phtheirospermum japonicum TaxID=374723 RepID=A0A830BL52_9LAMI|nr:very-long-chain 3-oxoacyl-coa reductase 1 [Phtheirospermum japonicum]
MAAPNLVLLIPASLGFIILSKSLLQIFRWAWTMFFRPAKNLKSYGSWAMVTGSTDGIGKALAFELACGGEEIGRRVDEKTKGLDLGIVVNNVGLAYPYAKFLHEVDLELLESVVRVNVVGTTFVTRAVILGMLEKKKKGVIVNVGSGSSGCVSSYPLYSVYAATKSYVAMLSRSLSMEYKQHGINVQCQVPYKSLGVSRAAPKTSHVFLFGLFFPLLILVSAAWLVFYDLGGRLTQFLAGAVFPDQFVALDDFYNRGLEIRIGKAKNDGAI